MIWHDETSSQRRKQHDKLIEFSRSLFTVEAKTLEDIEVNDCMICPFTVTVELL